MDNGAWGGSGGYQLLHSRSRREAVASALLPRLSKPTSPTAWGWQPQEPVVRMSAERVGSSLSGHEVKLDLGQC